MFCEATSLPHSLSNAFKTDLQHQIFHLKSVQNFDILLQAFSILIIQQ